ncbi:MAG TPA: hypothetical protein PLY70_08900 [Saprospiraceae bacterium]|nr:hypothetical protein [Saprospiraceae bacterium]HPN68361.1 hypothetical protein [Saprospiraceae bacterium]
MISQGSGDDNHLLASETKIGTKGVEVAYSQINGVTVDGIKTESSETLLHELVHANDLITGQVAKDSKDSGGKSALTRGIVETRAVAFVNEILISKGKPIRQTYGGIPVVDKNNCIIKGVKIP